MNFRTTLILIIILGLLGSYYYFFEVKQKAEEILQEEENKKVLTLKNEDINTLLFKSKSDKTMAEFVKKGDNWFLTKPVEYKADFQQIDNLLTTSFSLKVDDKIEAVKELKEYGLQEPSAILTWKNKKGDSETLKIGEQTPTKANLYLMTDKSDDVLLVPAVNYYTYNKKAVDLRDKDIIEFAKNTIKYLKIDNAEQHFLLQKEAADWQLQEPVALKADQEKIEELLAKLENNKVNEFVNDTPQENDLETYGLKEPAITISLGKESGKFDQQIFIGKESGDFNFIRNNIYTPVFKVNKSFAEAYQNLTLLDLRNKEIISFDAGKVKNLKITALDQKIEASQKDLNWKIDKQENADQVKAEDLGALVGQLATLKFTRIFKRDEITLGSRLINISLSIDGQKEPLMLTFGGKTKENEAELYLINPNEVENAYAVDKTILEKVFPES